MSPTSHTPAPAAPRARPSWAVARTWGWGLGALGIVAAVVAAVMAAGEARSAASQVWPPFVLVTGLLLVGLVADQDGLFSAAGRRLAASAPNGPALFAGSAVLVATVTALLNLDTSVVFLTPVLVYAARRRGQGEAALLAGCLLLSNAGSLLLPGSNLTNLIILGHLHLSGGQFLRHMALPWIGAVVVTAGVIALAERRSLTAGTTDHGGSAASAGTGASTAPGRTAPAVVDAAPSPAVVDAVPGPAVVGLGALAVAAVAVLVVVLANPALPVAGVGLLVIATRLVAGRRRLGEVLQVLGIPVLIGLFGIATALGTLGRTWSGPATLLTHLDTVGTAVVAALSTVVVNNLPAAALLASRVPPHPFALLIGLDLGPNLFVTGSLAWILWWRTARAAGSAPPLRRTVLIGLVSVPLSMAMALALLGVGGAQ